MKLLERLDAKAQRLDLGLLLLRLASGGLMMVHGAQKASQWSTMSEGFPDPFGVGHAASLALAIFAELFCALLVVLGAFTRLALVPLMTTMVVAAFIIHGADPWAKKELAIFYLSVYVALFFAGPGRYSVDHKRRAR